MTGMRKSYLRPTPTLTRDRDEGPRPACDRRWDLFDPLIDGNLNEVEYVRRTALDLCLECPLRPTCWPENEGEEWLANLRNPRAHGNRKKPAKSRPWSLRRAERITTLEGIVAKKGSVTDACAEIGVLPETLYAWCMRQRIADLFYQLAGSEEVLRMKRERRQASEAKGAVA